MALPAKVKTHQLNANHRIAAQGTVSNTNRRFWRFLVNDLIGFGSGAWTVKGSSDSSTASATDLSNRWAADANLVFAASGTAHSWIVLQQAGITSTFAICIDLNSVSSSNSAGSIVFSLSAGFTGGSTTARPTATDEVVIISAAQMGGNTVTASDQDIVLNTDVSTDGSLTRIWVWSNSINTMLWIFDKTTTTHGWTNPHVGFAKVTTSGTVATVSNLLTTANMNSRMSQLGTPIGITMKVASEGVGVGGDLGTVQTSTCDLDSTWDFFPLGLSSTTATARGRLGAMVDIYETNAAINGGDTFSYAGASTTQRDWVQLGILALPWTADATAPALL